MLRLIFEITITVAWVFILYSAIIGALAPSYPMFIFMAAIIFLSNVRDVVDAYRDMRAKQKQEQINAFIKSVHLPIDRRTNK